jgi:hypothetical protein
MISVVSTMENGSTAEVGIIGRDGMTGIPVLLGLGVSQRGVRPGAGRSPETAVPGLSENGQPEPPCPQPPPSLRLRFLHQISRSAACNLFHTIQHRCAKWLLMTWDRVGNRVPAVSGVSRADARLPAGAVASATLEFKRQGMIDYQHGRMRIRDAEGLKRFSCECYLLIRREAERVLGSYER